MILPLELLRGGDAADDSARVRGRNKWFRDRGVDPGDWGKVHPVLVASWRAHGIPSSALDRVWASAVGLEEWQRLHRGTVSGVGRA